MTFWDNHYNFFLYLYVYNCPVSLGKAIKTFFKNSFLQTHIPIPLIFNGQDNLQCYLFCWKIPWNKYGFWAFVLSVE